MKKYLLPLTMLFSASIFAKKPIVNHNIELKDSLLWEISGKNLKQSSYLYGTMHIVCDANNLKKPKVTNAIKNTRQLYLELDMDDPNMLKAFMASNAQGKKIKNIIDEDIRNSLLNYASDRFSMKKEQLENSSLISIMGMFASVAMPSCNTAPTSIEQKLIEEFSKSKKEILGLETVEQQMGFLKDSGLVDAKNLVKSFEYFDETKKVYKTMMLNYENEEISSLFKILATPTEYASEADVEKMIENILIKRNKNWADKIPSIIAKQATFIGVGSGHLAGDIGVINLLREQGYTVQAVMN